MKKLFFDRKTVIQFVGLRQKGFRHLEIVNQGEDGERESRGLYRWREERRYIWETREREEGREMKREYILYIMFIPHGSDELLP